MTELSVEDHVQAAQRQLRLRTWGEHRVDAAWSELTLRRARDEARRRRAKIIAGPLLAAAALALASNERPEAKALLDSTPDLAAVARSGRVTWGMVGDAAPAT